MINTILFIIFIITITGILYYLYKKYPNKIKTIATIFMLGGTIGTGLILHDIPSPPIPSAGESWYDSNWTYRKEITVTPKIDNYQSMINITKSSGGSVDCEGHCNDDFSDIRFTRTDGGTLIPYWIEQYSSGDYAHVWFNNTNNESILYLYYGNAAASDAGNGSNVFLYFDNWTSDNTGDWHHYTAADAKHEAYTTPTDVGYNRRLMWKFRYNDWKPTTYGSYFNIGMTETEDAESGTFNWDLNMVTMQERPDTDAPSLADSTHGYVDAVTTVSGTKYGDEVDVKYPVISESTWYRYNLSLLTGNFTVEFLDNYYNLMATSSETTVPASSNLNYIFFRLYDYNEGPNTFAWDGSSGLHVNCSRNPSHTYEDVTIDWMFLSLYNATEPSFSFNTEEIESGGWSNSAPSFSSPSPVNTTTGVALTPTTRITISDADGNATTVNWYYSLSDSPYSWVHYGKNTSHPANSSASKIASFATSNNTVYWWKVTAEDEFDNSTSDILHFTTINSVPYITGIVPSNNSIDVSLQPRLNVTTMDNDTDSMTLTWYEGNYSTFTVVDTWSEIAAHQGVTTDDTYLYTSVAGWSTEPGGIYQYWLSNKTLKDNNYQSNDEWGAYYCDDCYYHDADQCIYVAVSDFDSVPPADIGSQIRVCWASNLTWKDEFYWVNNSKEDQDTGAEGIDYHNNSWWILYAKSSHKSWVLRWNDDFSEILGYYSLGSSINGQTLIWYGNDIFTCHHDTSTIYRFSWNGNGFDNVTSYSNGNGISVDSNQGMEYRETTDLFYAIDRDHGGSIPNNDEVYVMTLTGWHEVQTNSSCSDGTSYSYDFDNASGYNHTYWWQVILDDGTDSLTRSFNFTTRESSTLYSENVRGTGEDYFVWLGDNTTLAGVVDEMPDMDSNDYVSVMNHTTNKGHWVNCSGTDVGYPNEPVYTFDIIRTNLSGESTQTIEMTENSGYTGNYENRTFSLTKVGDGVNYTCWSNGTSTTLSTENSTLFTSPGDDGYFLALWNETNYEWDTWICGFGCAGVGCDKNIHKWDVVLTKIASTRNWVQ